MVRSTNLAFVDPGPRSAPLFLEIRRFLEPRFHCLYYSRRMVPRGYIRSAGAPLFPEAGHVSKGEFAISDAELLEAIGQRELYLRKARALAVARRQLAELSEFLDRERVDALVVWNGAVNLRISLATWLARRRGLPVVHVEHGYLPSTLQIDLQGVNYNSSMTGVVMRGEAELPPDQALDRRLDEEIAAYRAGRPTRVLDAPVPDYLRKDVAALTTRRATQWLKSRVRGWIAWRGRKLGLDPEGELPRRFVLLPLQVWEDSQLVLHSPLVGNDMGRLIELLQAAVRESDPELRIVAKLHPYEKPRVQYRNLKLLSRFPDVVFLSRPPMRELLPKAEVVITVNSTVGFEALLLDKPVVTLGLNFYTADGIVHRVPALEDLPAVLKRALREPVDTERRRAFLRFVSARFLTFGNYHDFSERSLRAVADRIGSLLSTSAHEGPTPAQAPASKSPPIESDIASAPALAFPKPLERPLAAAPSVR